MTRDLSSTIVVLVQSTARIKVATWNVENSGVTKCKDAARMRKIASILDEYDLIALREVSNLKRQDDRDCPRNEHACTGNKNCGMVGKEPQKYLNQENGLHYQFAFSPQVKDERYLYYLQP